jgi:hypothetical protein
MAIKERLNFLPDIRRAIRRQLRNLGSALISYRLVSSLNPQFRGADLVNLAKIEAFGDPSSNKNRFARSPCD